ncbi:hypothetical protein GH714_021258 [Hevea brasiliensis]|uniref:Uncharacterized protein n=1 Tax=Hevea brasiliensis TaxID=3981 RepID=A0A6A6LA12_HEVBR|nr:hypothetical protein GH714_021258 [Hevea brasiliensis]
MAAHEMAKIQGVVVAEVEGDMERRRGGSGMEKDGTTCFFKARRPPDLGKVGSSSSRMLIENYLIQSVEREYEEEHSDEEGSDYEGSNEEANLQMHD